MNEPEPIASTSKANQKPNEPSEIDSELEQSTKSEKPLNMTAGGVKLRNWLNKSLRITMSDGRVLIGIFLCTDRDANVILGSCSEYLPDKSNSDSHETAEEPRMLGLVMVPGKHIINIFVDQNGNNDNKLQHSAECWNIFPPEFPAEDLIIEL